MSTFFLEVITPEKQFFSGQAEEIICETEHGQMGVLKGHAPMIASLVIGEIQIKVDGNWRSAFMEGGFMEIGGDKVTVFSELCEWSEDIDAVRALAEKEQALRDIKHSANIKEHKKNEISLARALTRLKIKNTHPDIS